MIDYRALLKKYMDGVGQAEGVDFILWAEVTDEELDALRTIRKEIHGAALGAAR